MLKDVKRLLALICLSQVFFTYAAIARETLTIGGVGSLAPLVKLLIADYVSKHPDADVRLLHPPLGSTGGLRALAVGHLDVVLLGRELRAGESGELHPWVKTPLVLVSAGGKTQGLSRKELAEIFAGSRSVWDDGKPIRLVLRGAHESETRMLRSMSPDISVAVEEALRRNAGPVAENDLEAVSMMASIPGSLGSTSLGLITLEGLEGKKLQCVAIDGQTPEGGKLANYPWFREYYLVTMTKPTQATRAFLDYLQSPVALAMARKYAYLPMAKTPPQK